MQVSGGSVGASGKLIGFLKGISGFFFGFTYILSLFPSTVSFLSSYILDPLPFCLL